MKSRVHAIAGTIAITLISLFMVSTILSELLGETGTVQLVKTTILYALAILIPSVMIAGGSGRSLGSGRTAPVLTSKKRRTAGVAAIGLLVLVPCAVVLQRLAAAEDFGFLFGIVQAVELVGGAVNLTLLVLNARAGRALSAARRHRDRASESAAASHIS